MGADTHHEHPPAPGARGRLAAWLMRAAGWRVVGTLPHRGIFIGAPHTSNWDFVLTVLVLWHGGVSPRVLVKRELFWWPLGPVLRALGAVPTDRGAGGLVERLTAEAREDQSYALVIAPDGTRRPTDHWKSGFYRIATATGMSVTLGFIDGPTRTAGVGPTIALTGDVRADMDVMRAFYADKHGVRPGRGSTPYLREEGPS
ncbi:1-acyl-sn-glycerol-3-phosphate acyltransferase [Actinotalea sp. JY-7876]|uniref:1-acyl-sn-glycerol-3-phosphate acyltransferase n=1 Tax=Actinotalea sp. JY-7876 TaxID=2758442 RepID=UPI0021073335|nr:1-acyl-sn-glycerol-3-phosphate acyltransferase [Actinotalea sp. JY-7876]